MSATTQIELAPLSRLTPHTNPHLPSSTSSFSSTIRRAQSNASAQNEAVASTADLLEDPDYKMPKLRSQVVIFVGAALYQVSLLIWIRSLGKT